MSKAKLPGWKGLSLIILALVGLGALTVLARSVSAQPRPERVVQDAWELMQQAGRYDFSSTVEQVTYPAPKLVNVGRASTKEVYYASGTSDLRNQTMQLGMWQNSGSLANSQDGIQVRIEGDRAYGRSYQSDWQEIKNFNTVAFAPGKDGSAYLVAARNVNYQGSETLQLPGAAQHTVARYSFELDPARFAEYLREQMVAELQNAGKLPLGMELSISEEFQGMEGAGSLWVDENGLPMRLQMNMKMAPQSNGDHVEIALKTDFFNQATENLLANRPFPVRMAGMLGLPTRPDDVRQAALLTAFSALLLALVASATLFSRSKVVYAIVAGLVIVSMLVSPVWQSVKAADFSAETRAQRASAKADQDELNAQRALTDELTTSTWNPNIDPLAASESAAPQIRDVAPAAQTAASEETPLDTDGDGLTDAYEAQVNLDAASLGFLVLDPNKADTDDDGLNDAQEIRLTLSPAEADSDHDGISDLREVQGFFYYSKDWYSDPLNKDTDKDSALDSLECPQLVDDPATACRDTDADGIPDIFDTDDDGDLIPTLVDESPYSVSTAAVQYSASSPFTMSVQNVDPSRLVFITYQVRPLKAEHLTYALNVLDWPSDDTDGQIQRINDTTFATNMDAAKAAADPRAAYGDMRLLPMLEVKLKGSSLPLPLTNEVTFSMTNAAPSLNAKFTLTGASDTATTLRLDADSTGDFPLKVYRATGTCSNYTTGSLVGDMNPGDSISTPLALGDYADGTRVVYAMSGATPLACAEVPVVAHGAERQYVVDDDLLNKYGASARQDTDGSVLVYAPLSLVQAGGGDVGVAFTATVPLTNEGNRFASSNQEVRLVWLLNMLTDICKPAPANSTDTNWCDKTKPERWYANMPTVVQTYNDDFTVTGLSVKEDRGLDMAVIFENPATDQYPQYEDPIWALEQGLEGSFIAGRLAAGGERDMTISEIAHRFDPDNNGDITNDEDARFWGMPRDAFQVVRHQYAFSDEIYNFIETQSTAIFNSYFNVLPEASRPSSTTLVFAREETNRMVALGEAGSSCGTTCTIDFDQIPTMTVAVLNWAPYQRTGADWKAYPLADYLDSFEARMRAEPEFNPATGTSAERDEITGQIRLARMFYEGVYRGMSRLVSLNGVPSNAPDAELDDQQIDNAYRRQTNRYLVVAKVVKTLAECVFKSLLINPGLMSSSLTVGKNIQGFFRALKSGIGAKISGGIEKVVNKLGKVFSTILGIAAVVAVVVVAAMLIWSLCDPDSTGGKIAARIAGVGMGLLSAAIGAATLQSINAFKATASASTKAAVIGLVVGLVITWGVFFASWGASGASAGSLVVNNLAADAIAMTITLVLFAILASSGVGAIIVGIIAIIDGLIMAACAAAGVDELEEDHWARQYICIGITGWVTKIIKWTIYGVNFLVNYDDSTRLEFSNLDQGVADPLKGMTTGNKLTAELTVTNSIKLSSIPIDWKAAAFWWQYTDSAAKSAGFAYKLQAAETDIHDGVERGSVTSVWQPNGSSRWKGDFTAATPTGGITMPAPGINQDPTIYFSEGSAVPVQECIAIPILVPVFWLLPVCWVRTEKASFHTSLGTSMTVDVFPNTLDEFYKLTPSGAGGYALAWDQSGTPKFPTLKDADGDSLLSKAFPNGNDPDDSRFDSDGDRLSDTAELQEGTDPNLYDTDDDGLDDARELSIGTSPLRKDTDGDGLTDKEEQDGWFFTYGFATDGTPLETMVYSDALSVDLDGDGLTDFQERLYGFNPNAVSEANILKYELSMREHDAPVVTLRFDETGSPMVFTDSSNFGFSASCADSATCPTIATGRYASALNFDGVDDALDLNTSARSLSFADNRPFTLAAWVYRQGSGTLISKWSEGADGQSEMRLGINDSGRVVLTNSASTSVTSSDSISQNVWTHVAASFDGAQVTFYIDGAARGTSSWSNTPSFGATTIPNPVRIGAYSSAGGSAGFFSGRLDEVAIFDRALTAGQIGERLVLARYNFNDEFVHPGEYIDYTSVITNLLNSRFAYGLLSTAIDRVEAVVDWAAQLLPRTFVLYPDNPVATGVNTETLTSTLQIAPDAESGPLTIAQRVSAQIVDRRTESNRAELWLKFNEGASASTFEDSSGNMPPRPAGCTSCPTSGETGSFNNAVKFSTGLNTPVNIATLGRMKMIDRGYTISMWVKPSAGSAAEMVNLLGSTGSRLALGLQRVSSGGEAGNYAPTLTINGAAQTLSPWRNLIKGFWNHLAVQYNDQTQKLVVFVNGAPAATLTGIDPVALADGTTDIAAWIGGSPQGVITWVDDVRLFSRPLTTLDINRLAERPVLQMLMDNSGFADTSGYGQAVGQTHSSVPWPVQNASGIRGKSMTTGSASNTGYVQVTGNSMLDMQDGAFTFSLWVYPTAEGNGTWQGIWGYRVFENETSASSYPSLERSGNSLRFGFDDGTTTYRYKVANNVLTQNKWNHIAVTFSPNDESPARYNYRLYVNAELRDTNIFSTHPRSSSTFYLGHSSRKYITTAISYYVSSSDDAGSQAEPFIRQYVNGDGGTVFGSGDGHDTDMGETVDLSSIAPLTLTNNQEVEYWVGEDDDSSADDYCGSQWYYWYDYPGERTKSMSNGFNGNFKSRLDRPSIRFVGSIDELEVYRYALDSEQIYDLYNAIPITARLALDDRPASDSFENRASVVTSDDGTCTGAACPAAGTLGLINQAVRFDGADDVISVDVKTTPDYMVSLWVNSTCADCGIYTLQSGTTSLNQVYFRSGNVCTMTGTTRLCTRGGGYADGEWHHVVYANNGAAATLWIDGVVDNSLAGAARVATGADEKALLGTASSAAHPAMNGQIDDVRVFLYSQAEDVVAQLNERAPLFLAHLDEPSTANGMQDATARDWFLECGASACPLADMEGRLGESMEFDGADDLLQLNQASFSAATSSFTTSLWVMPTAKLNRTQTLWSLGYASNGSYKYSLGIAPDTMNVCVLDGSASQTCTADSAVELVMNNWNFITLVVERTSASSEKYQLYINGYLDSTGTSNTDASLVSNGLGKLTLGNLPAGFTQPGGAFAGRLDEVSLYEYLLNEIDIRDAFTYQMSEVEEHDSLTMTIDAERPTVDFASYNAAFPYMLQQSAVLQVDAADAVSGVGMVEMKVWHNDAQNDPWKVAPACLDSANGQSFCPTFIPQQGDGEYKVTFRAADRVGNSSQPSPTDPTTQYTLYVDGEGPRITKNAGENSLQAAEIDRQRKHTWKLRLTGSVFDPTLSDGKAGSGLDTSSVKVTLYAPNGDAVGAGTQTPTLTPSGMTYQWALDYAFPEKEPTGQLTLVVEARDLVGNQSTLTSKLLLDASAPNARLKEGVPPPPQSIGLQAGAGAQNPIMSDGTLSGVSDDTPLDGLPYITTDGKDAASGVQKVQVAFAPALEASTLFNEPYPDGLLAWLPLDGAETPTGAGGTPDPASPTRRFLDISPYQMAGSCETEKCPDVRLAGHKEGSAYFNGNLQNINMGQQVDLAGRSFSIAVWAQRDQSAHSDPILWQGPVSMPDQRFLFGLNEGDEFVCGFGGTDLRTTQTYPDTGWHAWACTYDLASGERAIYRDGQVVAADISNPVAPTSESLFVGLAPVGSYKGSLDELVIFDHSLSAEGVRTVFTGYQSVYHLAVDSDTLVNGDLVADRSGYFQSGELHSGDALNRVAAGAASNYALKLNGGSEWVAVQPNYSLQLERGAFTQSAWIKPSGDGDIISERDENPEQRYPSILLTADNRLEVGFGSGYQFVSAATTEPVVTPGAWNHVAATFDGKIYRAYVNGVEVLASTVFDGLKPYPADRFNIGHGFNGLIDEVMVFTRPLSALEINALASQGWRDSALDAQKAWSSPVVRGLEGPYEVEVRGWDEQNHFRADQAVRNQWGGTVDTLAPRLTVTRESLDPEKPYLATFTFWVEDTMLDEASIHQNLCQELTLEKEYFNSSWFLAAGSTPNSALYRASGTCVGDTRSAEETGFYACDVAGNCSAVTYAAAAHAAAYLPMIFSADGTGIVPPVGGQERANSLREKALTWPLLSSTVIKQPAGALPDVGIRTEWVDANNLRSPFTLNLQGWAAGESGISAVSIRILKGDEQIYATRAAVYADIWNAVWLFEPGKPPKDGEYTLEVTAVDGAGQQSRVSRTITVHLAQ